MEKIFMPFFHPQAQRHRIGAGHLHGIVELHRGRIEVKSRKAKALPLTSSCREEITAATTLNINIIC